MPTLSDTRAHFRELSPAAAWREAERRAIVAGVVGFLLCASLSATGLLPNLAPSWLVLSGIPAFFLAYLALSLTYYHRCWCAGSFLIVSLFVLPFIINMLRIQAFPRSLLLRTAASGLVGYATLQAAHIKASRHTLAEYFTDLQQVDQHEFTFKSESSAIIFWMMLAVGASLVVLLLSHC